MNNREEFNRRYEAVMRWVKPQHTNPASPNENGDCEQSHHRSKRAVEQELLLRGSSDFISRPSTRVSKRPVRAAQCRAAGPLGGGTGGDARVAGVGELSSNSGGFCHGLLGKPGRRQMNGVVMQLPRDDDSDIITMSRRSYRSVARLTSTVFSCQAIG
jgi:hypothetical protein